jgi:hypothetical protein
MRLARAAMAILVVIVIACAFLTVFCLAFAQGIWEDMRHV